MIYLFQFYQNPTRNSEWTEIRCDIFFLLIIDADETIHLHRKFYSILAVYLTLI